MNAVVRLDNYDQISQEFPNYDSAVKLTRYLIWHIAFHLNT